MRSFQPIADLISEKLADRGDTRPVTETDSLFLTGRLDSMASIEIIMLLESEYGLDLADADFDITRIDTIRDLKALTGTA